MGGMITANKICFSVQMGIGPLFKRQSLKIVNLSFKPMKAFGARMCRTVVPLVHFMLLCCYLMPSFHTQHKSVCFHSLCDQQCLQPTTKAKLVL